MSFAPRSSSGPMAATSPSTVMMKRFCPSSIAWKRCTNSVNEATRRLSVGSSSSPKDFASSTTLSLAVENRPVNVWLCFSIMPAKRPEPVVRASSAWCTSLKPILPCSTILKISAVVTP